MKERTREQIDAILYGILFTIGALNLVEGTKKNRKKESDSE